MKSIEKSQVTVGLNSITKLIEQNQFHQEGIGTTVYIDRLYATRGGLRMSIMSRGTETIIGGAGVIYDGTEIAYHDESFIHGHLNHVRMTNAGLEIADDAKTRIDQLNGHLIEQVKKVSTTLLRSSR